MRRQLLVPAPRPTVSPWQPQSLDGELLMAWREELEQLRVEADAINTRLAGEPMEEPSEVIAERRELYLLAESLQVAQALLDLNEVVLGGQGRVESTSAVDVFEEDDDEIFEFTDLRNGEQEDDLDEVDLDDTEELRFSLYWDSVNETAIDVELVQDEEGILVLVNGEEISHSREVLEKTILDVFRKELGDASEYILS